MGLQYFCFCPALLAIILLPAKKVEAAVLRFKKFVSTIYRRAG